MKIAFVEIQNFRKLKSCYIDFGDKTTLFVGANNSGKTSAMEALFRFLPRSDNFSYTDFTISNWDLIEQIGRSWVPQSEPPANLSAWDAVLPSLDIWFAVSTSELQYVSHIIPTLKWAGGFLGVRLRLEPRKITELFKDYLEAMAETQEFQKTQDGKTIKSIPTNLREFLCAGRQIARYFHVVSYLLDPSKINKTEDSIAQPQTLSNTAAPITEDVLHGLVRIDIIDAQRPFVNSTANESGRDLPTSRNLSSQLRDYYTKHIDPMDHPDKDDLEAIKTIERAQENFDDKLKAGFASALTELETLGYPGFTDPRITLSSKIQPIESLNHATAVQFDVIQDGAPHQRLPEKLNGLGYQNLVSMVFKLILFRDGWMRVGKRNRINTNADLTHFEPVHLVLIEEPEAHLHAQVQQVFINKAYDVLRNHPELHEKPDFVTQLVVSTHSSYIAHESDFSNLRYFYRIAASKKGEVPKVKVVNLSTVFGTEDDTTKFATRYLKTTHCDLFFADAAILVEGPAERILLPGLVKKYFKPLTSRYLTILEIGGSHAHRLKSLIETLGIFALVVTDLDAIDPQKNSTSVIPKPSAKLESGNTTLRAWLPQKTLLDDLYAATELNKISETKKIRVAYQTFIDVNGKKVFPYTFEDAVILENLSVIKSFSASRGLLRKAIELANSTKSPDEIAGELFEILRTGSKLKAEFALELLWADTNDSMKTPEYIAEGLNWLQSQFPTPPTSPSQKTDGVAL